MSKKAKRAHAKRIRSVSKTGAVWHLSAEEATLAKKPRYNGYACGYGAHGNAKYNRAEQKRAWKKSMNQEGAPRGSFLLTRNANPVWKKRKAEFYFHGRLSAVLADKPPSS